MKMVNVEARSTYDDKLFQVRQVALPQLALQRSAHQSAVFPGLDQACGFKLSHVVRERCGIHRETFPQVHARGAVKGRDAAKHLKPSRVGERLADGQHRLVVHRLVRGRLELLRPVFLL